MSGNQLLSFTKVTNFDGEEENFPLWKMKFEAIATLKGFYEALQPILGIKCWISLMKYYKVQMTVRKEEGHTQEEQSGHELFYNGIWGRRIIVHVRRGKDTQIPRSDCMAAMVGLNGRMLAQ